MTRKTIAPYGRWASPISAEAATAGTQALTSPRSSSGRGFFLASRPDGSSTIYEATEPPRRVLPEPWGVRTTIYEYGGLAYAVVDGADVKIVFSDARDGGCSVLDVATGAVSALVPGRPALRYGDFDARRGRPWILAVQEDHTSPAPADVRNYVVAIHVATGEVVRVVEGADFYTYPRWAGGDSVDSTDSADSVDSDSADPGYLFSWREWDHPDLPFDGATLHWATWHPADNTLTGCAVVAGEDRQCVAESAWAPDGSSLVFGMEPQGGGFRQLFRVRRQGPEGSDGLPPAPEPIVLKGLEEAEFGDASFITGCQTFVFLTPYTVVAVATRYGRNRLVYAHLDTGRWAPLDDDVGLVGMKFDPLAALSPSSLLVVGSGFATPAAAYRVDLDVDACRRQAAGRFPLFDQPPLAATTLIYRSTDHDFPQRVFSTPELVMVRAPGAADAGDSEGGSAATTHDVYGWFWPPHNRAFAAPEGTLPPLIITPHGGPNAHTAPGLSMVAQYWATRGFAYFAINYSGSTGHGRAYRDRLWSRWGVLDRDDVAAAVRHLTAAGAADPARVGIEGGSAGGYNVLQSLAGHPDLFAGGVCCCGVADTAALAASTHKLESRYVDRLLWVPGETTDEEKEQIHRERSPLFHADRIAAPLRLIHGELDTVVPIAQSRSIQAQIRRRGGDVDLVVLPGEGHMFVKQESLVRYLTAEAAWWEKTLLK